MTAPPAAGEQGTAGPRFIVTVGTDHHPFDRLIGWVNDWLGEHPDAVEAFFVQSGGSRTELLCPGSHFLDVGQLDLVLSQADVTICHGGPGSIADAWNRGQVPIVVPRLHRFGEAVDDHQADFCVKLAALGRIRLAEDRETLDDLIDEAMADLANFRATGPRPDVEAAVARFGALVDELVSRPSRRRSSRQRPRRARGGPRTGVQIEPGPGDLAAAPPPRLAQPPQPGSPVTTPGNPVTTSASIGSHPVPQEERI